MFDKEKFSEILKKIINNYDSLRDFATKSNFNRTSISKYVRQELANPPTPAKLNSIAINSKGITTYEELMNICGYFSPKEISNNFLEKNLKNKLDSYNDKLFTFLEEEQIEELHSIIKNILNFTKEDCNFEELTCFTEKYNLSPENKKVIFTLILESFDILQTKSEDLINFYKLFSNVTEEKRIKIPVLGSIPAGIPIEMIQDIIDYEDLSEEMLKGEKEYFALQVNGDSMAPTYLDKDILIVLKQEDCESGQDCIVTVNGDDATFKRVFKTDKGITLQPLNNNYMPVFYSQKDIINKPVKILGIVKQIRRNI